MNKNSGVRSQESEEMREPARTFQDLIVWQKAHGFVLSVYKFTETFPKSEIYGLTSQFRRAAVSIPANIAEGFKKKGAADKVRFMNIAQSSLEECRYYLILSRDLEYGETKELKKNSEVRIQESESMFVGDSNPNQL
jgi:four helix bundle protein